MYRIMSVVFIAIIALAIFPSAAENEGSLYSYDQSILPYLSKTAENRCFWFSVSPDEKHWGVDWNKERLPFSKIMIHHTGGSIDQSPAEMEEANKQRYVARYESEDNDPYVKGLIPHSSHIVNGQETFLPYHYLVYENGTTIEWLSPLTDINGVWHVDNVAWHAGNWQTNCESISICLVGDYVNNTPTKAQISSLKKVISGLKAFKPDPEIMYHRSLTVPGSKYESWSKMI